MIHKIMPVVRPRNLIFVYINNVFSSSEPPVEITGSPRYYILNIVVLLLFLHFLILKPILHGYNIW